MEGFLEILTIIIGRYLFGSVGYFLRKIWRFIFKVKNKSKDSEFNDVIDVDDYKNRIVGFIFVATVLVLIIFLVV